MILNVLLECVIVFALVLIINWVMNRINKNNLAKGEILPELMYLNKIYKINVKKINKDNFSKVVIVINSFIITAIYIILMYLLKGWIIRIIVGVILLILMIIICYGLLGRYYLKKVGK